MVQPFNGQQHRLSHGISARDLSPRILAQRSSRPGISTLDLSSGISVFCLMTNLLPHHVTRHKKCTQARLNKIAFFVISRILVPPGINRISPASVQSINQLVNQSDKKNLKWINRLQYTGHRWSRKWQLLCTSIDGKCWWRTGCVYQCPIG